MPRTPIPMRSLRSTFVVAIKDYKEKSRPWSIIFVPDESKDKFILGMSLSDNEVEDWDILAYLSH